MFLTIVLRVASGLGAQAFYFSWGVFGRMFHTLHSGWSGLGLSGSFSDGLLSARSTYGVLAWGELDWACRGFFNGECLGQFLAWACRGFVVGGVCAHCPHVSSGLSCAGLVLSCVHGGNVSCVFHVLRMA